MRKDLLRFTLLLLVLANIMSQYMIYRETKIIKLQNKVLEDQRVTITRQLYVQQELIDSTNSCAEKLNESSNQLLRDADTMKRSTQQLQLCAKAMAGR